MRHERNWLRGRDLNPRPSGYEPDELPGCSTPRLYLCRRSRRKQIEKAIVGQDDLEIEDLAPAVGFEPTTNRLTADRSTTELLWIVALG